MAVVLNEVAPYMEGTYSPSSQMAERFGGVEIPEEANMDLRRQYVHFFVVMYDLLDRTGWYDHTGDWDFHIGVVLRDGREEHHFGDGAMCGFARKDGTQDEKKAASIGLSDDRDYFLIDAPQFMDEPDYEKPVLNHPFVQFVSTVDEESGETVWLIPIEQISRIEFGWCS